MIPSPSHNESELKSLLLDRFHSGLDKTVIWFRNQMTDYYFSVTPQAEQVKHLEILHAMRGMQESRLTMVDDLDSGKVLFVGRPGPGLLQEALEILGERPFHRLEMHGSKDQSLTLCAFVYGHEAAQPDFDFAAHREAILQATCTDEACLTPTIVDTYLRSVDAGYLSRSYPERVARHIRSWANLSDPEHIDVHADQLRGDNGRPVTRILLSGTFEQHTFITDLAQLLRRREVELQRCYLDQVPALVGEEPVLIASAYVTDRSGRPLTGKSLTEMLDAMRGLHRVFTGKMREVYSALPYHERDFEVLAAAIDFASQLLAVDHPFLDVREVGRELMDTHQNLCIELARLLDLRFGPKPKTAKIYDRARRAVAVRIEGECEAAALTVLETMLTFIDAVQLTNVYRPGRLGQSFKIDPAILPADQFPMRPYGIFYFHGNHGMGFQIRFRASARGGLRLLLPRTNVQLSRSRDKLLREVYDLAWAQQLKNKDIPEGGAKCIALVRPDGDADSMVHLLADALLDLVLPEERCPDVRGPYGASRGEELIFLGPDENMTPARISWVADRAEVRGLPHSLTFMSSKPGSGINHKEYGVTSEGLYRWLPPVLETIGIQPGQPWTVKMTGGPDGDVAGNLINILHREERDRCRIISLSDGTGCAFDPSGLDWKELLRLFQMSLGIAAFQPKHLRGEGAHVTPVTDKPSEQLRNHLHNRIRADVFIPCGGRPYTISDNNWQDFLSQDGSPSAKAMVEGANIFITSLARDELQRRGLICIKDSSANKGGVICSSYEILAGLVMSKEEFTQHKVAYVAQTIEKLRGYADEEAGALLQSWRRRRGEDLLSHLSMRFSEAINRVSGILIPVISRLIEGERWQQCFRAQLEEHCPQVLVDYFGDRLETHLPLPHRISLLAKHFASRMLYREGLTWCDSYVREDGIDELFDAYLRADKEIETIEHELESGPLRDRPETLQALTNGARRELVRRRLSL